MNPTLNSSEDENIGVTMPDVATEIARLTEVSKLEIEQINKAASSHQADLRKQLEWSKEEQMANVEVSKIRLKREIDRLTLERLGEIMVEGPIRKLPVELLSYIFRFYVDNLMSPWRLVKVCKIWMRTALATPHLWRYICVGSTIRYGTRHETWVVDGEKRISMSRMQVCNTIVQLRAALRRSGAVPLEIQIEIPGGGSQSPLHMTLLRIILSPSISKRIEMLDLAALPSLDGSAQLDLSIGNFDCLKKLHLPRQIELWTYALLDSICLTAAQIEAVRLSCPITPELAKYSFWSLLKALELNGSAEFNTVSERLVNLEEFPASLAYWPDMKTPTSTWLNIRNASIKCNPSHLDRARLPNLESLVFRDVRYSRGAQDIYPQLSYTELTRLDVETPDLRWLSNISAPLVNDLTVSCHADADDLPAEGALIVDGHRFPAVKRLTLTTRCPDTNLVDTLASFPILSTARLSPSQYKAQDFGLVLLKSLDGKEQSLICPNLAHLALGSASYPVFTLKKNAGPLLKRLVTSRKKIGKPFRELSVRWSKNSYTEENYA